MKKKKILLIMLMGFLLLTTGCGANDYILDKNKKIVTVEETGQSLQKNIYCKPSKNTEQYKLYQKYEKQLKVKLNKLPECNKFKITSNKTKSLWQFLFVKPLAYLVLKLGYLFKSMGMTKAYLGVSLMLIGLLIRFIILPFNIKTQKQSKKMQELMPEMQKIERKYANRQDQESMMMKATEMQALYKKYQVNPLLSCLLALIQLPIFLAFLQAIYKIPSIYEGEIFGWNLGTTPKIGILVNHNYTFIILIVLIALTTFFSFKYTMSQSKQMTTTAGAPNQMNTMLYIMTGLITITSFTLPTAIALYWIVTYAFIIIQTFIMNLISKRKRDKEIASKKGSKKNGKNILEDSKGKAKIKDKLQMKEGMKYGKSK